MRRRKIKRKYPCVLPTTKGVKVLLTETQRGSHDDSDLREKQSQDHKEWQKKNMPQD